MADGAETCGREVVQGLIDYLPTQALALQIEPENLVFGETGRRLIFTAGLNCLELWVLEGLGQATGAARSSEMAA